MLTVANPIYDAVFKYLWEDERVARTILSAASDAKIRQDMNVEEEYFQAIENRDTAIMMRDEKIKEQNSKIAEQGSKIAEQDSKIAEQKALIDKSIRTMLSLGLSIASIAESLNVSEERVRSCLPR